ncbi:MAG: succinate dehydrogenase assembly factor 2 [Methyloceanibacter sp.]|nr:succinate dehydrogenase assembly factor 2 [Methyloceanibacter sp.]
MSSDLGMRRRRAIWRASHRGTKEMDHLLGRFAEHAVDSMNADEIAVLERLIEMQDPEIELSVYEGYSLGDKDLDTLIALIRQFHKFPGARQ